MDKLLSQNDGIQLSCIQVNKENHSELLSMTNADDSSQPIPHIIHTFIESQTEVFVEPTTLPPLRSHNHKITLTQDASPVNYRPYRHSAIQKNIIEKQVVELLQQGFIRPSTIPFPLL